MCGRSFDMMGDSLQARVRYEYVLAHAPARSSVLKRNADHRLAQLPKK